MTVHLDLEDVMVLLSEAGYEGKITDPISYVSTKIIIPAGDTFEYGEEEWN